MNSGLRDAHAARGATGDDSARSDDIRPHGERHVLVLYAAAIGAYASAILAGYFAGQFPVIQGRFFLPVMVPGIVLFCYGLWTLPRGGLWLALVMLALIALDALSLFGNLLPYHYYWSAMTERGPLVTDGALVVPQAFGAAGRWAGQFWAVFYPRLLADKPGWLRPLLPWLAPAYALALAALGGALRRATVVGRAGV